jgi:hypothetical protein
LPLRVAQQMKLPLQLFLFCFLFFLFVLALTNTHVNIQSHNNNSCSVGSSIRSIAEDGSVICELDDFAPVIYSQLIEHWVCAKNK